MASARTRILEPRFFGPIIGLIVVGILVLLDLFTVIPSRLETYVLDNHFTLRETFRGRRVQEGVTITQRNPNISPDILILGIDSNSLSRFGRWPWPRYRHADLLNSLTRIKDQNDRERAVLLDLFFVEPSAEAYNDALLVNAIRNNGRTFLETILDREPPAPAAAKEFFQRQEALFTHIGKITNVTGDWQDLPTNYGLEPPLIPYAEAAAGYGHANFFDDFDKIYRHQPLIMKASQLLDTIKLNDLTPDTPVDEASFQRLAWTDTSGRDHTVPYPLTPQVIAKLKQQMQHMAPLKTEDTNNDGKPDTSYYVVRKYQDYFIPAITLSLALSYFHKTFNDIQVKIGKYIKIPAPEQFDTQTGKWRPYRIATKLPEYDNQGKLVKEGEYKAIPEITIPINNLGDMLINFMGPRSGASPADPQTFPVRSYAAYASRVPSMDPAAWPRTKALGNKIVLVGDFAAGIAQDEKTTPFGLMYGVEIHANALNTILMDKFIHSSAGWVNYLIMLLAALIVAFLTSRFSTILSFVVSFVLILGYFISTSIIFDVNSYLLDFSLPALTIFFTFLAVIIYRVMTEEKDKRRIRDMFGRYVSPRVVDQILENPPELGGVDKELSVFFSDIRGFTTLSETMTPQELVNHLNIYLTAMTDVILSYEGTLDKYVGDEIMCFWGAPLPQADHAILACKCAIKQMQILHELNDQWPQEKRLDIGIGVNSGIMTVGNMGSSGRMNYTLMGDNVNLGARLEGTNKQYMTNVIISEYTYGLVKDRVVARELDNIRVKGKNRPVLIYELIDVPEGLEPPEPTKVSPRR